MPDRRMRDRAVPHRQTALVVCWPSPRGHVHHVSRHCAMTQSIVGVVAQNPYVRACKNTVGCHSTKKCCPQSFRSQEIYYQCMVSRGRSQGVGGSKVSIWALLGSNQWPLRCERSALPLS